MKKYAAIIIGLTAIILLTQTNLLSDLLLFFLVGAIPGTTKSVPSHVMLASISLAAWAVILSFSSVRHSLAHMFVKARSLYLDYRTHLAKRRLGDA